MKGWGVLSITKPTSHKRKDVAVPRKPTRFPLALHVNRDEKTPMPNKHNPDSNTNNNITPWIHWNEICLLCLLYIRLNTLAFLSIYSLNLSFYYFTAGIQLHSQHDLYSPRPSPLCFKRFLRRLQRRTASRLLSHFRITMRERWSTILLFFRIWGCIEFSFLRWYFTSKRVMSSSILIEYVAHPH